jgi:PAS domain S-box-containing protein
MSVKLEQTAGPPLLDTFALVSDHPILQTDADGRITWVNEAFETLTGYTAMESKGKTPGSLLQCPETDPETILSLRAAIAARVPIRTRILNRSKAGRYYWLDLSIQPVFDSNGVIQGFQAIEADVTELVEALSRTTSALSARNAYQEALDKFAIVAITNRRGDIVFVNDRFCEISGYGRDELLGRNHRILNSGHHPRTFFVDLWRTISSGEAWHGEVCNRNKAGDLYWVDTTVVPLLGTGGKIEQFASIRYDITERKQLEARLRHASRLSAMGEMAAALAHELNQPLGSIVNYVSGCRAMLARDTPDSPLLPHFDKAIGESLRAGQIIRHLRSFVSSDSNVSLPEILSVLVDEALAFALLGASSPNVRLITEHAAPDLRVSADKIQIAQVILNLVRNALDAAEPGADLVLRVSTYPTEGGMARVSIADNGPGIEPEIASRLFELFVSTKGADSMGIGLSICRTIVEGHRGRIWVAPDPSGGTIFNFTLPLAEVEAPELVSGQP